MSMLNLCQVGLGPLGLVVMSDLVRRDGQQLVAAVDNDPRLAGKTVSSLISGGPPISIRGSLDALEASLKIDSAIVTTRSDLRSCMPTFRDLLGRGIDVISSCEELLYPWLRNSDLAGELDQLAKVHNARILGTGINPGFLMDALPIAASGIAHRVDRVEVWRVQDAASRRIPFQRKIGATLTLDEFDKRVADGTLRHVGLGESLHFVAHYLGLHLDHWDERLEPIVAEESLECGLGAIPAGHARGVLQVAHGYREGEPTISLEFRAAIHEQDPYDRIRLSGEPDLDLILKNGAPGDISTSAMLINSVAALRESRPGLHTMATIRPPRAR